MPTHAFIDFGGLVLFLLMVSPWPTELAYQSCDDDEVSAVVCSPARRLDYLGFAGGVLSRGVLAMNLAYFDATFLFPRPLARPRPESRSSAPYSVELGDPSGLGLGIIPTMTLHTLIIKLSLLIFAFFCMLILAVTAYLFVSSLGSAGQHLSSSTYNFRRHERACSGYSVLYLA